MLMVLKINVAKSKVLVVKMDQRESGEEMQDVDEFNYPRVIISADGGKGEEVTNRVLDRGKVRETMAKL